MHILDLVENSTRAGARNVTIEIVEDGAAGLMTIVIGDDGKGMAPEEVSKALDPFYTTKGVRKVGLGLSMMKAAAERCDGSLEVESKPGEGTTVRAVMLLNLIARPPMGDLNETLTALISIRLTTSACRASARRCPAPARSVCAAHRRSNRRRESCSAALHLQF